MQSGLSMVAPWLSQICVVVVNLDIGGASNSGLLMGAVLVRAPELFRAVYVGVPLLDMLRYHKFSYANIWKEEYGNADDPVQKIVNILLCFLKRTIMIRGAIRCMQ